MSETKIFNLLRTIVFGTLLFGLWEGPTFGCEILFEVGEENKTPFPQSLQLGFLPVLWDTPNILNFKEKLSFFCQSILKAVTFS